MSHMNVYSQISSAHHICEGNWDCVMSKTLHTHQMVRHNQYRHLLIYTAVRLYGLFPLCLICVFDFSLLFNITHNALGHVQTRVNRFS